MPTISKISIIGYSPIANRKLNQKASNPISANTQDSRDLMSPNAHYGRHAVSFKAHIISPEQAEGFLNIFAEGHVNIGAPIVKPIVEDLLTIIAEPGCRHLKDRVLGHLSDLSVHENGDVRLNTLMGIKESIMRNHAFAAAAPELLNHTIIPHLNNNGEVCCALQAAGECFRHIKPESVSQLTPINPEHIISYLDYNKTSTDISSRLDDIHSIAKSDFRILSPELCKKVGSFIDKSKPEDDPVNKAASSLHRTLLAPREILEMKKVFTAKSILAAESQKLEKLDGDSIGQIASFLHPDGSRMSENPNLILARQKPQQQGVMQRILNLFS